MSSNLQPTGGRISIDNPHGYPNPFPVSVQCKDVIGEPKDHDAMASTQKGSQDTIIWVGV